MIEPRAGARVTCLKSDWDAPTEWLWVKSATLGEGYVPRNFVEKM